MSSSRLLIVEDDPSVRSTIVTFLDLEGYTFDAVSSTREALERLQETSYSIVISDIYLDERTGLDVLEAARKNNPDTKVILMTARGSIETVMAATRSGAFDYLAKPFDLDKLLDVIRRAEASSTVAEDDEAVDEDDLPETELVGSSAPMVAIYKQISQIAPTDATVLLMGETGTGKELVARLIHRNSPRADKPFLAVDCGAITPSLLESELFGAMRGAFTGADRDRAGLFETANRGTVFLDEIGEIEPEFQVKLLRVLQEREIRPVGSPRSKPVDVRLIAATNRNLQQQVSDGKFRLDLWYRVNVVALTLPPLRERHGDVPLLAQYFVKKFNERYSRETRIVESGMRTLGDYTWPGNVRQLQHVLERLTILAPQARIDASAVRDAIAATEPRTGGTGAETLADTESDQIRKVLAAAGGNKSRAAKILGIERKTLYRKLERLGL